MTNNVDELILGRFLTTYGSPNTEDQEGFFGEYRKALGGVRRDVLKKVSDHVVWKHVYPTWPTVGRCLETLRSVNLEVQSEPVEKERWAKKPPTEIERIRVAKMTADFKARMEALESEYVSTLPPPLPTDRNSWTARQSGLLAAGKFCLSLFMARRAA